MTYKSEQKQNIKVKSEQKITYKSQKYFRDFGMTDNGFYR